MSGAPGPATAATEHLATVLVIDDSEAMRREIGEMLKHMGMGLELRFASGGLDGYRQARAGDVDLILCDMQMPTCDGMGFLRLHEKDPRAQGIPTLMLTSSTNPDLVASALDAGAVDFLHKPVHPAELRARISVQLRILELARQLQQKADEMEALARTDGLTGVQNRRSLDEALARECDRAQRYRRPLSFLLLDVDHFKRCNDTFGHQAGDHVLASMARLLHDAVRQSDLVARYGGEEFALLLPETSLHNAARLAERLRTSIADLRLSWEGDPIPFTVSVGVASIEAESGADAHALVAAADAALYAAKQGGRNRIGLADSRTPEPAVPPRDARAT